ncbi:MAG: PAS domain S-box protein, partial [Caldilineaceae bacterium]|nr:PAS domain S-box protein [Caldilineaceae bacterium]
DVITRTNAEGIRTFVTPSCYALFGYTPDELTGRQAVDLVHPDEQSTITAIVVQAVDTLKPSFTLTQRIRHQKGHYLWVEVIGTIIRDGDSGAVVEIVSVIRNITERRAAEEALRESEARYRLLTENAFDIITRNNIHGDFVYVSPSVQWLLGYSPDELITRSGFELLDPAQWQQMNEMMRKVSERCTQPPQVFQIRHKTGRAVLLEISMRAIFSEASGDLLEFVCSARDITEQKRAEEALRASEEKFRQVAENFDQLLIIRSADNQKMLFINSAAERLTGVQREQLSTDAKTIAHLIHPDDIADVQQQISQQSLAGERIELEYRLVRPNGQICWVRVRKFPIKDEDGTTLSQVITGEDITERKESELILQESEAKYRQLVETMRGGLVVFDTKDRMTYVNDRMCELLGYAREELLNKRAVEFVDNSHVITIQTQAAQRKQMVNSSYEILARRKDGTLVNLLVSASPLRGKTGTYDGGIAVITDITAQKQAEEMLRQALRHEQELSELKSRFVSTASHEFRTPLATISATTETLINYRERFTPDELDVRLRKILTQVKHMKEIMEDVLQLARIQTGRIQFTLEPGDLEAFCSTIVEEFRSQPDYHQRLQYTYCHAPAQLHFDRRLMRHIISNLIANGLKYSSSEHPVRVDLRDDTESIVLQVSDQGIGIPEADLQHIFEPFHRAGNVGTISGTGLGLCITKEAVDMHGGTIHIDTEVGTGTTFTVTVPTNRRERDVPVP